MGEMADFLEKYGAYNAANLDGGTSATLVVNNQVINSPVNINGEAANGGSGRYVVTSWGLLK
jgi:exopolysaccharide biosynthesis protein